MNDEVEPMKQDPDGRLVLNVKVKVDVSLIPNWVDYIIVDPDGCVWGVDRDQAMDSNGFWESEDGGKDQRILLSVTSSPYNQGAVSYVLTKERTLPF